MLIDYITFGNNVIGVYINTSVWNLFIIPEEDWSQSKSIEEYEVNKLKNEDGYSCFYAFVQNPRSCSCTREGNCSVNMDLDNRFSALHLYLYFC